MVRRSLGMVYEEPELYGDISSYYYSATAADSPGEVDYDYADTSSYVLPETVAVPGYSVTVTASPSEVPYDYADTSSYTLPGTPASWEGDWAVTAAVPKQQQQGGFGIPLPLLLALGAGLLLGLRN